jgi:hypothetical protein
VSLKCNYLIFALRARTGASSNCKRWRIFTKLRVKRLYYPGMKKIAKNFIRIVNPSTGTRTENPSYGGEKHTAFVLPTLFADSLLDAVPIAITIKTCCTTSILVSHVPWHAVSSKWTGSQVRRRGHDVNRSGRIVYDRSFTERRFGNKHASSKVGRYTSSVWERNRVCFLVWGSVQRALLLFYCDFKRLVRGTLGLIQCGPFRFLTSHAGIFTTE